MSISVKDEEARIDQGETMIFTSRNQQSDKPPYEISKEYAIRKQLACLESRKSILQSKNANKIPNMKEQMETSLKLLKFVAESQLTLTQVNGQRKLGPPPGWTGPPPGPKCEIFVGSIPRNYYEPEIVMIFSTVGKIYELRLMMEFSGTNRGYCFIMYATEEEAARAVKELDQYEIYPGKRIGVVASTNNCRLYINQLPRAIDSESIVKKIYEVTDDIDKVSVYRNSNGFVSYALVSYKTHRGAAMGRRRLVPESATLFKNCEINIEWANLNITPSNVLEESGTCDEHGNVEITKTFIQPVRTKKIVARTKHKNVDKYSNEMNNQRAAQQFVDVSIRKGRAIKAATESSSSSLKLNQCEKCELKNLICSKCSMMEHPRNDCKTKEHFCKTWDINGNLRKLDQSILYEHFKENYMQQQDQSNVVLPSISTYLNRGKRLRASKWNDMQKCSEKAQRTVDENQISAKNLSNVSCGPTNKCRSKCSCQCRFRTEDNVDSIRPNRSKDFQCIDTLNTPDSLVQKLSGTLRITNDINHVTNGLVNSYPASETNHWLANYFQNANYYQNFAMNTTAEQNNGIAYSPFPNQNLFYCLQNVREPSQQFLSNDVNPAAINQNFSSSVSLPDETYRCKSRQMIAEVSNGLSNDFKYTNNYQNINSQQQIYESHFLDPSTFHEGLTSENPSNSLYSNETNFAENSPQIGENFQGFLLPRV
ncbi:APOBEC1 complementation factor [Anthophora plagiata]